MEAFADEGSLAAALDALNPAQKRAAMHRPDGAPLLVLAGAGTGKTTTIAHRVAALIGAGVPPARVLLLTFGRRAAAEMLRRADALLRHDGFGEGERLRSLAGGGVWGGTFHAIATRLLRLHGEAIGLDPSFTILDRGDSEDLLNLLRSTLGFARTDKRFPKKSTCLEIYSRSVNSRLRLGELLPRVFPWCHEHEAELKELFRAYVDRKAEQSVLDYDDLLLFFHGLIADPAVGPSVRERFDCVLVDEYQDTNGLQAEILALLRPGGRGLTVVGDDAQSIYSFRAATVRNILDFDRQFPGAEIIKLEQNYRSTPSLLAATNQVISHAAERHEKTLWSSRRDGARPRLVTCRDEAEQTAWVIERVLAHREEGVALRRQAVLFRAAHHSLALELELSRRHIPFHKYGGLRFVETAHVKDLTAFLRLVENPRDAVAGMRVLLLLPGVGPKKAQQLMDVARGEGLGSWKGLPPPAPGVDWDGLVGLLEALGSRQASLPEQLHRLTTFYAPLVEERYDHFAARMRDLEQLEQVAARYDDRRTFLAELTLDPPSSTQELAGPPSLDDDWLNLSTIHSAKGLEWDAVFLIHAADGNLPSDLATGRAEEIEEERRLAYVALSRARDHLYVTFPQRYYTRPTGLSSAHSYAQLSRFFSADVRARFDEAPAVPAGRPEVIDMVQSPGASTEIRNHLRAFWS